MVLQKGKWIDHLWFSNEPTMSLHTIYKQAQLSKQYWWLKKVPFYTKHIDLKQSEAELWEQLEKTTKYEINRATKRDLIQIEPETDWGLIIDYHQKFAAARNLSPLSLNHLKSYGDNLQVTKAYSPTYDQITGINILLMDKNLKRARGLFTASLVEDNMETKKRRMIGRANRLHIYSNFLLAKEAGFEVFDLGGYALNTNDKTMMGINKFKDCFGGELIEESHYYPIWIYWLKQLLGRPI